MHASVWENHGNSYNNTSKSIPLASFFSLTQFITFIHLRYNNTPLRIVDAVNKNNDLKAAT
jgi:hypothetical protein